MSGTKTGAPQYHCPKTDLKFYINTGEPVDSALTARMLENIFTKLAPARWRVIIKDNRIVAARCVLPVTRAC